jgi:hypothetical protein
MGAYREDAEKTDRLLNAVVRKEEAKRKLDEWKREHPGCDPGGLLDVAVDAAEAAEALQRAKKDLSWRACRLCLFPSIPTRPRLTPALK